MEIEIENGESIIINKIELDDLISKYNEIALKFAKKIDSGNLIGTYAEILVCDILNLKMAEKSKKGYDAISKDTKEYKYQIKSRWGKEETSSNGQNEFGSFGKENGEFPFNYLVLVFFNKSLLNPTIYMISSKDIDVFIAYTKGEKFIYKKNNKWIVRLNRNFEKEQKNGKTIKVLMEEGVKKWEE